MKKLRSILILLVSINVILAFLALEGVFEGKDLLPLIIGGLSILLAIVLLFLRREGNIKLNLFALILVIISAGGLYYSHYEVFISERENLSRENSIRVLKGNMAPTVTYEQSLNLDNTFSVSETYANNQFTILNFWATWCAPCLKEMPVLDEFHKENKAKGVSVIGFTDYKRGDSKELAKIKDLVRDLNINYPILIDSTTNVRVNYKAGILPASVLIDDKGNVLDYQVGIDGAKKIMNYVKNNI